MASSKVMASSNSRKANLSRRSSSSASSAKPQSIVTDQTQNKKNSCSNFVSMTVDGILPDVYDTPMTESTLLDAQITLIDTPANATSTSADGSASGSLNAPKSVDDVWREIVSGERRECKEEAADEMMTLEDFLAKAEAVEDDDDDDVKMAVPPTERVSGGVFAFDHIPASPFPGLDKMEASLIGFGNGAEGVRTGGGGGRGKRRRPVLEQLDKAAQQRQRKMIKNRESAARSRERKQAYQLELESLAVRLEEENEQLMKEKAERNKERYKQLMEKVIPVVEKRRPPQVLRRVCSSQW